MLYVLFVFYHVLLYQYLGLTDDVNEKGERELSQVMTYCCKYCCTHCMYSRIIGSLQPK